MLISRNSKKRIVRLSSKQFCISILFPIRKSSNSRYQARLPENRFFSHSIAIIRFSTEIIIPRIWFRKFCRIRALARTHAHNFERGRHYLNVIIMQFDAESAAEVGSRGGGQKWNENALFSICAASVLKMYRTLCALSLSLSLSHTHSARTMHFHIC